MEAKEKAKELVDSFEDLMASYDKESRGRSKRCALIAVDEIINEYDNNICFSGYDNDHEMWNAQKEEWVKVKKEIEKL
jgi:hypothetical protein